MASADADQDEGALSGRAFWVIHPGRGEILDEELAPPGPDEVLVRTRYSAISRGTEALVFQGLVPESERARMRAPHQAGDFDAAVKYGYCNVGVVERGPASLRGRPVFCLYPHQTRYTVPAAAVVPLPTSVPASRAVLAANMETAINGLWDADIEIGDRVAVVGAGVVGCLVAYLARQIPGCEVELVDIDERKREVAVALGVGFASPSAAATGVDRVVHTSGSGEGLRSALALVGREGTIVELSWFGARSVELPLGGAFHSQRLRIVASQVGTLPASQRARWTHRRRLELALSLLADETLDVLFSDEVPFDDLPQAMVEISDRSRPFLCRRIVYGW